MLWGNCLSECCRFVQSSHAWDVAAVLFCVVLDGMYG